MEAPKAPEGGAFDVDLSDDEQKEQP